MNRARNLVGLDVEMAQLLGRDLGVAVEIVVLKDPVSLPNLLASGRVDITMAGIAITPERASEMLFSEPYLNETLAFIVKDYLREEFSSSMNIRELGSIRVTMTNLPTT